MKFFKERKQKKLDALEKARLIREAKIRGAVMQAQQRVTDSMQFLEDLGSYNARKKYLLTDKELEEKKQHITNQIFGQVGILTVLSALQQERDAADKFIKKGKRLPLQQEAEDLIKELFK